MSAIFGIINLNDSPVKQSDLLSMQNAMDCWGPDGKYLWCEGNAGLGQLQLYNTPESEHERFPLTDSSGNLVFIATCRIDNRDELFHKLSIPYEKRITLQNGHYSQDQNQRVITDAELIFDAYMKYGKDCVHHLLGDWSFAVWDKRSRELFLARDHYGITSLYYHKSSCTFAFSSSFKSISNTFGKSLGYNSKRIIQIICGQHGNGKETCKEEVDLLPPAHFLSLKKEVSLTYYWEMVGSTKNYANKEEVITEFNYIFNKSVNCRTRAIGEVGTFLSSGLDSGSVGSVAAQQLSNDGKILHAFTSVPKYSPVQFRNRNGNEGILAQKIAQKHPNIKHYLIDDGPFSPFNSIEYVLNKTAQPINPIANSYWLNNIFSNAKERNCTAILTGQFGNFTISWPSFLYISNKTPKYFLAEHPGFRNYLKSILPPWIIGNFIHLKYSKYPFVKNSFLNNNIFNSLKKEEAFEYKSVTDLYNYSLKDMQIYMLKPGKSSIGALMNESVASEGLEMRDPTIDKRIIDFCISLPDHYYILNGNSRLLVKNAMKDVLPKEVINYKQRGKQASDAHKHILTDIEKFNDNISNYSKVEICNNFINFKKLKSYTKNISLENKYVYRRDNAFLRAIQVCNYLTKY